MMSAHDVAVAALNEVASHLPPESRVGDSAIVRPMDDDGTATSIQSTNSTSKDVPSTDGREPNVSFVFQSSSSNNSQSTVPEATTPPSSDELSSHSQQSPSQPSQHSQPSQPVAAQLATSRLADTTRLVPGPSTNAGQKRTLDGNIKSSESSSSSSASPPVGSLSAHSRSISSASPAVNSRELVSELRTRLSYAIVKVHKGWEDLPIEEVESRTSQAGSPTSSTSTLHGRRNLIISPRSAIASLQARPEAHDGSLYGRATDTPVSHVEATSFVEGQRSRTYESFWREQSQRSGQTPTSFVPTGSRHPSLAPSADIGSASRGAIHPRRSEPSKFTKPPTLVGQSTSDMSQDGVRSMGAHTPTPRTPNRHSHPVDMMLQTTNHKSLQERDAIETLLFMSSPGNSNNMGHNFPPSGQMSQQPSPLRADFGAPLPRAAGRSVEFTGVLSHVASEAGSTTPLARKRDRHSKGRGRPGDDIYDVMLDGLPDSDSSDDEIEIPITPRRLAASRM